MANVDVGAPRHSEIISQSRSSTAIKSDSVINFSDDGLGFLPTEYPIRELVTFSIFASGVVGLVIWGGWKLIQVIF
jgi:hypothetical protein